jgi:hypothetical protein
MMKCNLKAKGINILAVHHLYPVVPFFDLNVGESRFIYNTYYDHNFMRAEFGNV